jgi:hypothetical protein
LVFLLCLFHLENHVCLSCGVQVVGAAWHATMRIVAGVGDLVQRTGDGRTGRVLGGQAIERSVCQRFGLKTTGTVCKWFGLKTTDGFTSVWASKPMVTVCEWFGHKTTRTVFIGLASKPAVTVFSSLVSKLVVTVSPGFASKPTVGFLFEPQNQCGGGFPGLSLKTGSSDLVIWASKSP